MCILYIVLYSVYICKDICVYIHTQRTYIHTLLVYIYTWIVSLYTYVCIHTGIYVFLRFSCRLV